MLPVHTTVFSHLQLVQDGLREEASIGDKISRQLRRQDFKTAWYAKLFQCLENQQFSLKVSSLAMVAACLITTAIAFLAMQTLLQGDAQTALFSQLYSRCMAGIATAFGTAHPT